MRLEYILTIIIIVLGILIGTQDLRFDALELEITDLKQDQSWSASQLNICLGQVKAYDKAFDYHVVLSELGLYPAIKEELYLQEKGKGGK